MPLSEQQNIEMYKSTLETRVDIGWIKEQLKESTKDSATHGKRLSKLENDQSFLKGKFYIFVVFGTFLLNLSFFYFSKLFIFSKT